MSIDIDTIHCGDCIEWLKTLPGECVHCCVTSPPYFGLRDYGHDGQIGLEETPEAYVAKMVEVFGEVRRVLRGDGTLWLNLGDTYWGGKGRSGSGNPEEQAARQGVSLNKPYHQVAGDGLTRPQDRTHHIIKPKDLIGIPWRVAFALQADGWYLRQDIIWQKLNPMPESVTDRCTKSHEYIFLMSKSKRYYYDHEAIKEDCSYPGRQYSPDTSKHKTAKLAEQGNRSTAGLHDGREQYGDGTKRNKRSVWTVNTKPYKEAHFATYPPALIEPCIMAGCPPRGKRCDCGDIIKTPLGSGVCDDPTITTGRAGMNRTRKDNEGTRPITKREQRWYAKEIRTSPHLEQMAERCGDAIAHYIRTDDSGARPLPPEMLADFKDKGWLSDPPPCTHPTEAAGIVLDPFMGAGTTAMVATGLGRHYIGCELNPESVKLAKARVFGPMFGY